MLKEIRWHVVPKFNLLQTIIIPSVVNFFLPWSSLWNDTCWCAPVKKGSVVLNFFEADAETREQGHLENGPKKCCFGKDLVDFVFPSPSTIGLHFSLLFRLSLLADRVVKYFGNKSIHQFLVDSRLVPTNVFNTISIIKMHSFSLRTVKPMEPNKWGSCCL